MGRARHFRLHSHRRGADNLYPQRQHTERRQPADRRATMEICHRQSRLHQLLGRSGSADPDRILWHAHSPCLRRQYSRRDARLENHARRAQPTWGVYLEFAAASQRQGLHRLLLGRRSSVCAWRPVCPGRRDRQDRLGTLHRAGRGAWRGNLVIADRQPGAARDHRVDR